MTPSTETLDASYAACRRVARRSGSSFYGCFLGLPRAKRRAMDALYAFMRHTDDLADDPMPVELRRQSLDQWRTALDRALQGRFDLLDPRWVQNGYSDPSQYPSGRELLPALCDIATRYEIPPEYLRAVIDGVETDLTKQRYQSFGELEAYCEQVASAVGLACIHIWGFRGRQALELARKCGIALQLTNILRDIREDLDRDRVYLPIDDMRECGYAVEDLVAGRANERFAKLMEHEIGRAEGFYHEGLDLLSWLEPDGRRVFGMIMSTYLALLKKIKRRPGSVLQHRVRVGRPTKLLIIARWTLLPPRVAALL